VFDPIELLMPIDPCPEQRNGMVESIQWRKKDEGERSNISVFFVIITVTFTNV